MIIRNQGDVTSDALAAMERTADPRVREILVSLIKHLHAFVRDVRLTEDEFRQATAVLNQMGKLSTDTHNESVLMAGSLGVSSLVCLLNNGGNGNTETSQSLLGPFWRLNSPRVANGGTIVRSDTPGDPLLSPHGSSIWRASRSPAPKSISGTLRRSACTRTRTQNRPT
jgi:catechol 1,2-dioxygenase